MLPDGAGPPGRSRSIPARIARTRPPAPAGTMKPPAPPRILLAALLACLAPPAAHAQGAGAGRPAAYAFTGVSVVAMEDERVLPDQTVLVRDGIVRAVGPRARVRVPADAVRIDGRGKYLMPGLAEMHAHVPGDGAPRRQVEDVMLLYVANGVTTIRGMLGAPGQLRLREEIASGELLGPAFIVGAPSLSGNTARDPATAARLVREHRAAGYDFLKLHPGLSREVYDAIVAAAREVGMTTGGHVSQAVGLERTLEARQATIDHLDGYLEAALPAELRARLADGRATLGEVARAVEGPRLRALAEATRRAGVWNVPTAFLWESFYSPETAEAMARRPEMRYATAGQLAAWSRQKRDRAAADLRGGVTPEDARLYLDARRRILRALSDAGAPILLGTDSPQMFSVPGFSLHREMALMAEVGMTPYQVLAAGTRNVARYAAEDLELPGDFGVVRPGSRADLLLLDANPLADVRNVARRAGVMVRGRWLPAAELDRALEALAARNAAP